MVPIGPERSSGTCGDAPLAEPFVPLGEEAELVVRALDEIVVGDGDDRRGDRQRVETALADRLEHVVELRRQLGRHAVMRRARRAAAFWPARASAAACMPAAIEKQG